jgi:hypothetical protein
MKLNYILEARVALKYTNAYAHVTVIHIHCDCEDKFQLLPRMILICIQHTKP